VVRVGRVFFDLGRDASYAAAHRGDILCIEIANRKKALTAPLRKLLDPNAK